ncbi:type II toxin-antitoxin system RelE family toxin, partial [Proteus mirabilis]
MMYSVKFRKDAEKEWKKLDKTIQSQFAKQLIKRCENPHVALRDPL